MSAPYENERDEIRRTKKQYDPIAEKFGSGVDLYVEEMKTHGAGLSTNADFKKRRYRAIMEAHSGSSISYYCIIY